MSFVAKIIAKKILKERVSNGFGQEDPYFESVPATRLDGTPTGKVKKRKKALPPGVSVHDGRVLTKVKRRAWRLDMCLFSCCGVRFGWGSAIGIIPAIGDVMDAFMALMVFRTCCKVEDGLPGGLRLKMMFNIAFDFALGLVPFVGDIADAAFRCNTKNAVLLEEYLREKGKKNLLASGQPVPTIDPSDPDTFDRRVEEVDSDGEVIGHQPRQHATMSSRPADTRRPAGHSGRTTNNHTADARAAQHDIAVPAAAKTRDSQPASRGWFNWGRSRQTDLERADAQPGEVVTTAPPVREPSKRLRRER
ncbi:hypothetical protein B0T11DRAFT_123959 [Plectosphaerella cucumerina]|uniref:PH domain-containing protein n=1 Tax=Plectosphaerella cucumerina TaxID=40658 RepID=A0A8K0T8L8_9PEZI|nr:hypothetical protein B0T11DRAFT_123959 [Plectosphaerella cucumerina]